MNSKKIKENVTKREEIWDSESHDLNENAELEGRSLKREQKFDFLQK
jgi:hypothetical protein